MEPLKIIDKYVKELNPTHVVGMFSGGHDSLVATHVASKHPSFDFALHINTGIGIQETRGFVRNTCKAWEIELREYKAAEYINAKGESDPQIYEEIVKEYGFPGPAIHAKMYVRLKERPLSQALRELDRTPRKDNVLLITGVRAEESTRRMAHVQEVQKWGCKYWVAPILGFTKTDINSYIEKHRLKRNPVVEKMHSSGECLCGAYAHDGELKEIEFWYPEVAKKIKRLEREVWDAGHPWGWEDAPPGWISEIKEGQLRIPGMLCAGCTLRPYVPQGTE